MEQLLAQWTDAKLQTKAAVAVAAPTAVATAALLRRWWRDRDLPPGPAGLPLIGPQRLLDQTLWHVTLTEEAKNYDGVFSFYLGSQLIIVVSKFDLIKELVESTMFTGRNLETQKIQKNAGVVFNDGPSWHHHRRTGLRVLRDFGFARPRAIEMLYAAMRQLFEEFDGPSERKQPVAVADAILGITNSVIAQLLFGKLLTKKDPKFAEFIATMNEMFSTPQVSPFMQYPVLRLVDKVMAVSTKLQETFDGLRAYNRMLAKEREEVMAEEGVEAECLCDVYIQERKLAEQKGDFETYKEDHLLSVCVEFFAGGTDTTARTVEFLLLQMAFNPKMQQRVQQELHEVVGEARLPNLGDKTNTHFTNAVIDEVYRTAPVGPLNVAHRALQDTTFKGYRIPKEAIIFPHIYATHHDPQLWESPNEFRPQRFLDENGRYSSSPYVIPFSIGRRACIGESMARMEVFLIFAMLMQRYSVAPTDETIRKKDDILMGRVGLALAPSRNTLLFTRR